MKKILILLSILFLFPSISHATQRVDLHFFWSSGCPHCEREKVFLTELEEEYDFVDVYSYSMADTANHAVLNHLLSQHPGKESYRGMVPLTFVGNNVFLGFNDEIGENIRKAVQGEAVIPTSIMGIDTEKASLATLAVIIGTVDGFNVCSMGALILILALVLGLRSRRLTLLLGGLFILTTVLVYGLLVFVWHQIFSILAPLFLYLRIFLGVAAFLGGAFFVKEFFKFLRRGPVCGSQENKIVGNLSQKVQNVFNENKNIWSLIGVVLLFAGVVTIVEFPCSAVFPAIYASRLAEASLAPMVVLGYISLYLLFYMIDEIIVFAVAVYTKKLWLSSSKIVTIMSLIGAAVLFYLSYYYLLG